MALAVLNPTDLAQGLSAGTTHSKVAGGGSVPTVRRYSLAVEPEDPSRISTGGKLLSSKTELKDALSAFQQTFLMVDATKPDLPIMFASEGFYQMTGYTPLETIGKNCRFLQGADTDKAEVAKLKQALQAGESWCGRIVNYKKDGSPFWNLLTISPVKDDNGKVAKFIGMITEVTKYTEGKSEKDMRPNALPMSLIKYDARQREEAESTVAELTAEVTKKPHPLLEGGAAEAGGGMESLMNLPKVDDGKTDSRKSGISSLLSKPEEAAVEEEEEDDVGHGRKVRRGMDLATTLERIQKNFVITDPRLPENPIIFASDDFLELTEYTREEIIGRNCRFLQGKDTNMDTVRKVREALDAEQDITVQLLNYTKSGKPFWNMVHMQAIRDNKGVVQYFVGVQLDASQYVDPKMQSTTARLPENIVAEGQKLIEEAAKTVDVAVKELPDAGTSVQDLWAIHNANVAPKPHRSRDPAWAAIQEVVKKEGKLGLKHFRPVKPLGCGDTGSVHLVELRDSGVFFAMKAMDKEVMINRNKVHRACTERDILGRIDHPFLPTLYASFQTATHVCLITEFCKCGELYGVLEQQKGKRFSEDLARFVVAEVLLALEYLHCQGVVYRDLKPENVLLAANGHAILTDFDLSFLTTSTPELKPPSPEAVAAAEAANAAAAAAAEEAALKKKKFGCFGHGKKKPRPPPIIEPHPCFVAEPEATSNSFVGTEEYIAPEIISGTGHSSPVDWWAFGIFMYELLYGRTPFRGRNRQRTFTNILTKELTFPENPPVSPAAKQLMRKLLERDPEKRLGTHKGATEIKEEPFFDSIQWSLLLQNKSPLAGLTKKEITTEADSARPSMAEEEMDWDENEARPSLSLDYSS